ncbi:MAG: diaminopimelate epimerase, partial [Bacteroidales bacterium]|nr:diaminopimelate epimerase [Bacteroidales bacterium]
MIQFYKYHGAGNDFIMLNLLDEDVVLSQDHIKQLCDRHKGIGADGLMLLMASEEYDFEMKYYNSDGGEGSMCGNGGRCMVSFAYDMGLVQDDYEFMAVDGLHKAYIKEINGKQKQIKLQMSDVDRVATIDGKMVMDTGSPHYLDFRDKVKDINVFEEGKAIRYSDSFKENGVNVNFIESNGNQLYVRTYERGVEDETLACGTGATAAAIASCIRQKLQYKDFDIKTEGGE